MTILNGAAQAALAIGRSDELMLIVKATALLGAGLLAAGLLRRVSASARHIVLACTFGSLIALPAASAIGLQLLVGIPVVEQPAARTAITVPLLAVMSDTATRTSEANLAATEAAMQKSFATVLRLVWVGGMLAGVGSLVLSLWSLRRLRRHGIPTLRLQPIAASIAGHLGVRRSITVLTDERVGAPLTFGVRRPVVMLPADVGGWSDAEIERALVHEIEHVRRFDWCLHLVARIVCAVFWFNPLVWIAEQAFVSKPSAPVTTRWSVPGFDRLRRTARGPCAPVRRRPRRRHRRHGEPQRPLGSSRRTTRCAAAAWSHITGRATDRRHGDGAVSEQQRPMFQIVEAASDHGASVAAPAAGSQPSQPRGDRSLYRAAIRGDLQRMTELIDGGANVDRAFDGDGTPLIGAAREGRLAAVRLLLDRGASVNQVVPEDENALIQASGEGRLDVVKLLLARGADVNIRAWAESALERPDGEWRTALSMARRGRHDSVVRLLLAAGARE